MDQDETWYAGRPRLWPHCVRLEPSSPFPKTRCRASPIFGPFILWPNGWMDQDGTWHEGQQGHIVLDGDPVSPSPKRGHSPQLSAHFYCGQTVGCIKMLLGMEVGLGQGHIMLDGDPPKRGTTLQFSAHVYCGQTTGWIKMALGMEIGLSPDHIVLDGDPAPPPQKKRGQSPQFRTHFCCGQRAEWINIPLGTEVGLSPCHIVLDGTQLPLKRGTAPRISAPAYCGQRVAYLSYC